MSDASTLSVEDLIVTLESPHYESGVCRQAARELSRLTAEIVRLRAELDGMHKYTAILNEAGFKQAAEMKQLTAERDDAQALLNRCLAYMHILTPEGRERPDVEALIVDIHRATRGGR